MQAVQHQVGRTGGVKCAGTPKKVGGWGPAWAGTTCFVGRHALTYTWGVGTRMANIMRLDSAGNI